MDDLARDFDAAIVAPAEGTQKFIVISRYQGDPSAVIHFAQDLVHHAALRWAPVPAAELPAVDDVADQMERLAAIVGEEIGKPLSLAAARAQVDISEMKIVR